ncbi:MAG: Maf family protein, partial [Rhodospirillaceae bacterium]
MSETKNPAQFILASSSPRRRDLLAQIGLLPDQIVPAEIDETPKVRELPVKLASRLARDKAYAVSTKFPGKWVLGADTVVACGRRVLGKPEDRGQAGTFLRLLSGRRHRVIGGICLIQPD